MAVAGIQVKICGIRQAGDAEYAQTCGADYIGMIHFPKSPRYVVLDEISGILPAIAPGKRVVVTVEPEIELVEKLLNAGADYLQIHLRSIELTRIQEWSSLVTPDRLWLAPKLPPGEAFPEELLPYAKTMLIDTYSKDVHGGTGKTGDWQGFRNLVSNYPDTRFILAGGLNPGNVRQALEASGATAIDVGSGVEAQPGIKDREKIAALFRQLEADSRVRNDKTA